MPSFNRRGFLQFLSAAGVAPLIPSLPTRAVASTGSVSASKALWAGIYAKSGSASKFVGVAQNMGLPSTAIQGISTRSVGVRIAVAATSNPILTTTSTRAKALPSVDFPNPENAVSSANPMRDLRRILSQESQDIENIPDHDGEDPISPNPPYKTET